MTNFALEIMNLNKKEIITMDTVSNQDFTEVKSFILFSSLNECHIALLVSMLEHELICNFIPYVTILCCLQ